MTVRTSIVRGRLAALIACSLIAAIVPISATAEYGIPAGSGAVITAGQPLQVRVTPGWDAEVSYEIADGSYVTVWGAEQAAADGSLWYPVDGGFVPAEAVTSVAAQESSFQAFQEAAPATGEGWVDPATGQWVEAAAPQGWVDPATGQWVEPAAETWVQEAPSEGWVDPATGQWVEPAAAELAAPASEGWVDPATGQWVEPAPAESGWVDPTTGQWVEATAQTGWVDPNTGEWVEPAADTWSDPAATELAQTSGEGWVDPATGQWVEAVAQEVAAPVQEGWVDPATGQWVEPQPALTGWIDPATGQWVESKANALAAPEATGWIDPATGQWVDATQPVVETAPVTAESVAPAPNDEWSQPAPANIGAGGVEPWGEPIATAYISGSAGEGAVCRAGAERGTERLAILGEGEAVEVRGEAVGDWQPVNCAGVGGYVNTSYIGWEPVAAAPVDAVEQEQRRGGRNRGGGSGAGNQIVNFAMQYEGYPYVYAGEGPYAFDCSGFTKFVIQNTLGLDITHDMFAQYDMGQQVSRDALQPGDLVFFANTFRPGMSHNGIYIGNGQMIHAENESTGVKVSDINSDYYSSRWFGAVRFT